MLTLQLIQQVAARGEASELLRLAAYSEAQFVYYANQVPVIFAYQLADNAANQARGIAGQNSGYRQGVRNLNYVPAGQHPAEASAEPLGLSIRYYDLGRGRWRSYRRGNLLSISAFWSEALGRFVDTPEEAGIARGVPFQSTPRNGAASISEARAARTEARQQARRQREGERQAQRTTDRAGRQDRRRQNSLTRSAR
ncbi:MAG: hypothetical protein ACRYFK_14315 [Janthinobacterium lividum]